MKYYLIYMLTYTSQALLPMLKIGSICEVKVVANIGIK